MYKPPFNLQQIRINRKVLENKTMTQMKKNYNFDRTSNARFSINLIESIRVGNAIVARWFGHYCKLRPNFCRLLQSGLAISNSSIVCR